MSVEYFDNIIPFKTRDNIFQLCSKSTFRLGWPDSEMEVEKATPCLHSCWSEERLNKSGIFPYIDQCIQKVPWFTHRNLHLIVLNLTQNADVHYIHVHPDQSAVLYYVNLEWRDGWHGETIFYNPSNLDEVLFTSVYKPGRIILFDGNTPHAIRPQSIKGPRYRMTLTLFFNHQ